MFITLAINYLPSSTDVGHVLHGRGPRASQ